MTRTADRVLVGIVVAVVLLGGVIAWVASRRTPEVFAPGTPEAVVQEFLGAALDRDDEKVLAMLSDESCTLEDLARAWVPESARIVLVDSTVRESSATVRIEVTEAGDLLGGGWSHEEVVGLTRDGATWLVRPSSWPYYDCGGW
ncbi:MAG: hypothetical protein H5T83_10235 [Actinotalea sp.]|nr:hypothetical protein [Actinotalea sp.]